MTWTYDLAALGSSSRSWVRMRVGDCTSGDQLMQDEEIDAIIGDVGDKYLGAARCAHQISAMFARRVQKSVGKLSLAAQQASERYLRLGEELYREAMLRNAGPWVASISESEKDVLASDSDRVQPQFYLGQTDVPGSGGGMSSTDSDLTGW